MSPRVLVAIVVAIGCQKVAPEAGAPAVDSEPAVATPAAAVAERSAPAAAVGHDAPMAAAPKSGPTALDMEPPGHVPVQPDVQSDAVVTSQPQPLGPALASAIAAAIHLACLDASAPPAIIAASRRAVLTESGLDEDTYAALLRQLDDRPDLASVVAAGSRACPALDRMPTELQAELAPTLPTPAETGSADARPNEAAAAVDQPEPSTESPPSGASTAGTTVLVPTEPSWPMP